jgi:hypothetical protein
VKIIFPHVLMVIAVITGIWRGDGEAPLNNTMFATMAAAIVFAILSLKEKP